MKIRLFTIPNMLTLANLICGSLAIYITISTHRYDCALSFIILASIFDFFDGFAARLLKQTSPVGVELDSLADMVSFGLAPAIIMLSLVECSEKLLTAPLWVEYAKFIPLIIVAFSALRLAKFNIDEEQHDDFIGLPTPACALFCVSLGLLYSEGVVFSAEAIVAISIVMATFLLLPIKMFSLKFKGFGWRSNETRYLFMITAALLLAVLRLEAISVIIPLYIATSTLRHTIKACSLRRSQTK